MKPDLDVIQQRADAATAGPWRWEPDQSRIIRPDASIVVIENEDADVNDMRFIAHAREDIPALIARVRELEDENARIRGIADMYFDERQRKGDI